VCPLTTVFLVVSNIRWHRSRCGRAFLAKKSDLIELANDVIISARADLSARAIVASIGGAGFAYKISQYSRLVLALPLL